MRQARPRQHLWMALVVACTVATGCTSSSTSEPVGSGHAATPPASHRAGHGATSSTRPSRGTLSPARLDAVLALRDATGIEFGQPLAHLSGTGELELVLFGSSSCPATPTRVTQHRNGVVITFGPRQSEYCTSDLAPTGWLLQLPAALRTRTHLDVTLGGRADQLAGMPTTFAVTT